MSQAEENKCLSIQQLRRRWKPTKDKLQAQEDSHPTCVRLHRAFSWLHRCEQAVGGQDDDLKLMCQWIAFNALYGRWDSDRREPLPDRLSWQNFLARILQLDASGHVRNMLTTQRSQVMAILEDEYLSSFFWEDPSDLRAGKSRKAMYDARTWYLDSKWGMILERVLERIYLIRCQLVHGAATFGGKLNRSSLARCVAMNQNIMNAMMLAMIDHGGEDDWGLMCYPPLGGNSQ